MRNHIGYQVGITEDLPLREAGMINLIVSAVRWQEEQGPCAIFVNEEFYRFLVRTEIDTIYQDLIGLPEGIEFESAVAYGKAFFDPYPCEYVASRLPDVMTREEINANMAMIPEQIRERWEEMLLNEEMILSLGQHNKK